MDENQLAKISTLLGKIISLQRELWKMGSSGSDDKKMERRLRFKVFSCFHGAVMQITLEKYFN